MAVASCAGDPFEAYHGAAVSFQNRLGDVVPEFRTLVKVSQAEGGLQP